MVPHMTPPGGASGYPRALSPDRGPYGTQDGYIGVFALYR
ncbi:MAG: hypothetical protein CM1200mP41_30720 [Gammaproteobacteria bacterium]|nr:MAG: hypothetical protein CM1200mP41_30720 [Gammaproteobacteria bacterium]